MLALAVAVAAGCAARRSGLREVTIVVDPAPFATIAEAANAESRVDWSDRDTRDDAACTAAFAATELARYLPGSLGVDPARVLLSTRLPAGGHAVVVGSSDQIERLVGVIHRERPVEPGSYRLAEGRRGGLRYLAITGADRTGTLYGCYALLEQLGACFPGLGPEGTIAPLRPASWPEGLRESGRPAFSTRGFWAWEPRGHPDFFVWMARNRLNLWTAADTAHLPLLRKLCFRLTGGGHTIQADFLPPSRHFAAHPEWYGLHDGRRSPNLRGESGDNFCTSNPEARRTLAENVARALSEGTLKDVDRLELWMLDGGRWCSCRDCAAQGTPSERMLAVAAEVASAMERARQQGRLGRDVEISAPAYLETLAPPAGGSERTVPANVTVTFFPYFRCYAHALADPACAEMNRRLAASLEGWVRTRGERFRALATCEYYNVGAFKSLPLLFSRVMAADLAGYRDRAISSIATMHAPTRDLGVWTLQHWLFARLAWNPGVRADSLVDEFCRSSFPRTAAAMREHYRLLETASANVLALQHAAGVYGGAGMPDGRLAQESQPIYPLRHLRGTASHPPTDDGPDLDEIEAAMNDARKALDQARQRAREAVERARLAAEERRFAYGEAVFQLYAGLIRTAEAHRSRDGDAARRAFQRAHGAAERLRTVRDLVQVSSSHANARDGLEASGVRPTYEFFAALYGR